MAENQARFCLRIKDIFSLEDGRTVLVGAVDGGENVIIKPGLCDVFVADKHVGTIDVQLEIPQRSKPFEIHDLRAVSTRDAICMTQDEIKLNLCRLEGPMSFVGHRHLLGIDSPPTDYV